MPFSSHTIFESTRNIILQYRRVMLFLCAAMVLQINVYAQRPIPSENKFLYPIEDYPTPFEELENVFPELAPKYLSILEELVEIQNKTKVRQRQGIRFSIEEDLFFRTYSAFLLTDEERERLKALVFTPVQIEDSQTIVFVRGSYGVVGEGAFQIFTFYPYRDHNLAVAIDFDSATSQYFTGNEIQDTIFFRSYPGKIVEYDNLKVIIKDDVHNLPSPGPRKDDSIPPRGIRNEVFLHLDGLTLRLVIDYFVI